MITSIVNSLQHPFLLGKDAFSNRSIVLLLILLHGCNLFGEDPAEDKPNQLNELWRYTLNTAGDAKPTFVGDTLIFAAFPNLYAASNSDSLIFWESYIDNRNEYEDKVFLIDHDQIVINQVNHIKAFSRSDGKLLWEYDTTENYKLNSSGKHEIHPKGYYFIARRGNIVDITKTGEHVSITDVDSAFGLSGVIYLNGVVYMNAPNNVNGGFTQGLLKAVDYETAEELWRYETDHCGFYEKPIIEEGIMYAASSGNSPKCELIAINIVDGNILWKTVEKTHADKLLLTPNNFIINTGGSLRSYSKSDGSLIWVYKWEANGSLIQPVYSNGYVYMSDHGNVYILDVNTGELAHKAPSPGGYIWHLAVNDNRLFVQTDRQLIAYQPWHLREDQ